MTSWRSGKEWGELAQSSSGVTTVYGLFDCTQGYVPELNTSFPLLPFCSPVNLNRSMKESFQNLPKFYYFFVSDGQRLALVCIKTKSCRPSIRFGFSLLGVYLYHFNLCASMFVTNLILCVKIVFQWGEKCFLFPFLCLWGIALTSLLFLFKDGEKWMNRWENNFSTGEPVNMVKRFIVPCLVEMWSSSPHGSDFTIFQLHSDPPQTQPPPLSLCPACLRTKRQ